jgi:hypothetical protein
MSDNITMNELCETCGEDLHDDNREIECACGEIICGECRHEHNQGCAEWVAEINDQWGPSTPAGSKL